jgi:hypothetical protein
MSNLVVRKEIRGGIEVVKLERVQVICPACGQQVEAVASDGRVKGYCAIAKQYIDVLIEKQHKTETKVEISAGLTPMREGRDSRGHFVKGKVGSDVNNVHQTFSCCY